MPSHPLKGWGTEQLGKEPETEWVAWVQVSGLTKASFRGGEKGVGDTGPHKERRRLGLRNKLGNQSTEAHPQTGKRLSIRTEASKRAKEVPGR